jgi:hypothetical protein
MLARLDSLIAVLRVAQQKAAAARAEGRPNPDRLQRMQDSLGQTLDVCGHARRSLGTPPAHGVVPTEPSPAPEQSSLAGCFLESASLEEFHRLRELGEWPEQGPSAEELEALCARLAAGD